MGMRLVLSVRPEEKARTDAPGPGSDGPAGWHREASCGDLWPEGRTVGGSVEDGQRRSGEPDATIGAIQIGHEWFPLSTTEPFVFGRADAEGVLGLDANDMGISAIAGSVEMAWGVWWVVNQSTKRPLVLEHPGIPGQLHLAPGHRHALMTDRVDLLVPGAIYTHVLCLTLPESYAAELRGGTGRLSTGTLTGAAVRLTPRDRDALAGLCAGYLESFPRRREHPNTYEEAARLLGGGDWTGAKVRKAVERVKQRYAQDQAVYFDGPQANYDLAARLISDGVLTGADLARLPGRRAR